MIKYFQADQNKLQTILDNYEERQSNLSAQEKQERKEIIETLQKSMNLFKDEMNEQTRMFEQNLSINNDKSKGRSISEPGETQIPDLSAIVEEKHGMNKVQKDGLDGISEYDSANGQVSENQFDTNILITQRALDNLERKHLLVDGDPDVAIQWHLGDHMTHSYYLDTLNEVRRVQRVITDLLLVCFTMLFLFAALSTLVDKGYIDNYHVKWLDDKKAGPFIP